MIDIHTHILPMIDDGPATIQESIEMCRIAVNDGIKKIIATPHVQSKVDNEDTIFEKIDILNKVLKQEGLDLVIFPGAELHLNDQLLHADVLKESRMLTLNGNKKYILLEFSFQWVPPEAEQVIFALKAMGFTPILPHLERNFRVQNNPGILIRFVESGAILQVTAQSIVGNFGRASKKCVLWMLRNSLVHVIASDAHSPIGRPPVLSHALKVVSAMLGEYSARKMVLDHPKMILEGIPFVS
ncbi:MAG: hypothetical protein L3J17_01770 [Candidatus Jettenia sp.]|nr:MAG: hypothetical protein L3J17_01770 [Candidatus Jettenia sp.]